MALVDKSNLDATAITLGSLKMVFKMAGLERDVTIKRVYVKDDTIVVAFANGEGKKAKKYSVEVPINCLLSEAEFIVRSSDNSAMPQKTDMGGFIDWIGLK